MADQWHYRIFGEDFGPVSEATIHSLIAEGTIGPADEIRPDGATDWQQADSFNPLASDESPAEPDVPMDLDALLASSDTVSVPKKETNADQWYYRCDGVQHGPLDFDTLFDHVATGRVARHDEVLSPGGTDWEAADSIVGLFPDEASDLETLLGQAGPPEAKPAPAARQKRIPRWYYRAGTDQLGPVDFETLFELVQNGTLRSDHEIRGTDEHQWQRADAMVGLFPEQPVEESSSPPSAAVGTDPPTKKHKKQSELPEDMDADDWAASFLSEPDAEPSPAAASPTSEPVPKPVAPAAVEPAAASSPSPPPAAVTAPLTASRSPRPIPLPKPRRSGPSFSMPSLPSNLGAVFANPVALGGAAVALLVVGLLFIPWGSLSSPEGGDLVVRVDQIWSQVKPLSIREASAAEWKAIEEQVDPQLQEIAQEAISRGASPDQPVLQIVKSVTQNEIPLILESRQKTNPVQVQLVESWLGKAKELTQ